MPTATPAVAPAHMQRFILPVRSGSLDDLSQRGVQSLLASARTFKHAGSVGRPLSGRYAAVLSESRHGASAEVFAAAATALGAAVVYIRPSAALVADSRKVRDTARMLGRLYCALACDGVASSTTVQVVRWAGVPVFDAVAEPTHPTRLLGDLLTMCEHAGKSPEQIRLRIGGDPRSSLAVAWRRLAELTGIDIGADDRGNGLPGPSSDFVCEPAPPNRRGPPTLLALDGDGGQPRSLHAEQARSHCCIVQALLSDSAR